jgi:hypothetical protein
MELDIKLHTEIERLKRETQKLEKGLKKRASFPRSPDVEPPTTAEEQRAEIERLKGEKKEIEKELEKQASMAVKPKYYYDVKVECLLPATLTYRVLAEDPQQAAELVKGKSPNTVQHRLIGRKELHMKVYDAGGSMMRFMKKILGGM